MCFIWNPTFDAVFCSYTWIAHITLCAVGLQWHKMNRKYPEHPSSSLPTTAVEEKQTSHRLLFVFFFGFFMPWYECICDRFDCWMCCDSRTGIFKWNFDNFLLETGCCWIAMAQNEQEMPWASQQQLAHNSCWEKQGFNRLLFLFLFGLFTPWYECICDRLNWRQCCDSCAGIFKWNFW